MKLICLCSFEMNIPTALPISAISPNSSHSSIGVIIVSLFLFCGFLGCKHVGHIAHLAVIDRMCMRVARFTSCVTIHMRPF